MNNYFLFILISGIFIASLSIIIGIALIIFVIKWGNSTNKTKEPVNIVITEKEFEQFKWNNSYQPKYLLTINEKNQYKKLKTWATNHNLIVFTKVRVLDLIEPRKGIKNYKTLFYKIQAKHVDFVICDQDIKVKCIIELDDASHDNSKRKERDKFLTEALSGAGYKVYHTRYITPEFLNQIQDNRPEP